MLEKLKRWSGTIIGIVVLGALGSGLWDICLKPALREVFSGVLNLATLGLLSTRTMIYTEIARGFHEEASVSLLTFCLGVGCGAAGFLIGLPSDEAISVDQVTRRSGSFRTRVRSFFSLSNRLPLKVILLSFVFILTLQSSIVVYRNEAISFFNQITAICRPFMSATQSERIRSDFAQVRSKEDFDTVTKVVLAACGRNPVKLPEFKVW